MSIDSCTSYFNHQLSFWSILLALVIENNKIVNYGGKICTSNDMFEHGLQVIFTVSLINSTQKCIIS